MPPIKEFYGPLMHALEGDDYKGDTNGEFNRQMFQLEWEDKTEPAQMLPMVHFAEHVMNKQGVSEDFWDFLAPVIDASKFNFQYLGAGLNTAPTRSNTKFVGTCGHGKSPHVQIPVEKVKKTL